MQHLTTLGASSLALVLLYSLWLLDSSAVSASAASCRVPCNGAYSSWALFSAGQRPTQRASHRIHLITPPSGAHKGCLEVSSQPTHLLKAGQLPEVLEYLQRGPRSVDRSWGAAICRQILKGLTAGRSRGYLFANVSGCHICTHCGLPRLAALE